MKKVLNLYRVSDPLAFFARSAPKMRARAGGFVLATDDLKFLRDASALLWARGGCFIPHDLIAQPWDRVGGLSALWAPNKAADKPEDALFLFNYSDAIHALGPFPYVLDVTRRNRESQAKAKERLRAYARRGFGATLFDWSESPADAGPAPDPGKSGAPR